MDSYGYVETRGLVTAIEAADAALKAANVTLTNCYYVKGGIVTIEVMGDVAAVNAAVDAASESAKRLGNFLSSNVIARVASETKKILISDIVQENEEVSVTETLKKKDEEAKEEIKKAKKHYQDMKVADLKTKVNSLKLGYTWNQIKTMPKKKLIEILIKNNQEE